MSEPDPLALQLEFLFETSENSLQDFELAALNRSSAHLRAARIEWNAAVDQLANAQLARFLRDHRDEILDRALKTLEGGGAKYPSAKTRARLTE